MVSSTIDNVIGYGVVFVFFIIVAYKSGFFTAVKDGFNYIKDFYENYKYGKDNDFEPKEKNLEYE